MSFEVITDEVEIDGDCCTVYGISYMDESLQPHRISDITTDYNEISALVVDFNLLLPDPVHIYDIIEDFCFHKN